MRGCCCDNLNPQHVFSLKQVSYFGVRTPEPVVRTTLVIADHLLVVVEVNGSLSPLASRDFAIEQDIDLTVGATLHLGEVKVGHDEAEETGTGPNVARLSSKVSGL